MAFQRARARLLNSRGHQESCHDERVRHEASWLITMCIERFKIKINHHFLQLPPRID